MSNIKFARPHRPSVEELAQGVLAGNRALLGRAITLIESNAVRDQESSRALISRLLPHSGNAVRIGITGVPGAGKSSFIEAFGTYLCKKGSRWPCWLLTRLLQSPAVPLWETKHAWRNSPEKKTPSSALPPPAALWEA